MDSYRKPKTTSMTPAGTSAPGVDPGGTGGNISIAPLVTMIAVLVIILFFCFMGAPAVRDFCRRRVCFCCPEPDDDSTGTPVDNASTTPTIILLPFGRMLVVDRSVFTQFQTDEAGLDFMELSANLIRAHRLQFGASTPSILDSDTTSKGLSPTSLGLSPPAYEDIYGDLPPSYSEVSLLFRRQQQQLEASGLQERTQSVVEVAPAEVRYENERSRSSGGLGIRRYLASEEDFDVLDTVASRRQSRQSSF